MDRRAFLKAFAAALGAPRIALADEALLRRVGSPQDLETPLAYFDRLVTPTEAFFVRSHFGPPSLDRSRTLSVDGLVKRTQSLTTDEMKEIWKETTVTAVLQCAGNGRGFQSPKVPGVQWGHGAMGQAVFGGVPLRTLLERGGVAPDAAFVRIVGADAPPKPQVPAFVRSIPMARAMDPSTLVAWSMNGEPLSLAHGAPLRLVVPGWAGDHWVKWLVHVSAQKEEADGFFMRTAYKLPTEPTAPGATVPPEKMRSLTTLPVKSVIAKPADGGKAAPGAQEIAGCAFSGEAPIDKVEISIDDAKTWTAAKLEGEPGAGRWVVFRHRFDAQKGRVTALARATDKKGNVQPRTAAWNPSGYFFNAWHTATWEVA